MKKTSHLLMVGACVLFSAGVVAPVWATSVPTILYVSPIGNDTTGTGTLVAPYATITHAIAVAPSGTRIVVEPGTYPESLTITQKVEVTPDYAAGGSAVNTIIDAQGASNGITIAGSQASGTVISGLTVENADNHGVFVQNSNNVVLKNLDVTHNGGVVNKAIDEDKAIELVGTANNMVANNTVANNDGGIGLSDNGLINPGAPVPAGVAAPSYGNIIQDNIISGDAGGCGIVVAAYNPGQGVWNNLIVGNQVSTSPAGIVVAADVPSTVAEGNAIIDNTATNNFLPGIILHSNTPGDIVSNNSVIGNTVSANLADPEIKADNQPTGIIAIGAVDPVTRTIIAGNRISSEYYGIYLYNAPSTLGLAGNIDSGVTVPVYPSTPTILFPLVPSTVNTHHRTAYFYAGLWPGEPGVVGIAKYAPNGTLRWIYPQRDSSALADQIGSVADGVYEAPGHYAIPPS